MIGWDLQAKCRATTKLHCQQGLHCCAWSVPDSTRSCLQAQLRAATTALLQHDNMLTGHSAALLIGTTGPACGIEGAEAAAGSPGGFMCLS
jgi:hypothetical protein